MNENREQAKNLLVKIVKNLTADKQYSCSVFGIQGIHAIISQIGSWNNLFENGDNPFVINLRCKMVQKKIKGEERTGIDFTFWREFSYEKRG